MPSHLTSRRASSNRMPMTSWHLPVGRRSKGELARREKPFATTASATTTHLSELRLSNLRDTWRRSVHLPLSLCGSRSGGPGVLRAAACRGAFAASRAAQHRSCHQYLRVTQRTGGGGDFLQVRGATPLTRLRVGAPQLAPRAAPRAGPKLTHTRGRRRPLRPSISPLLHARTSATSLNARRWLRSYPC